MELLKFNRLKVLIDGTDYTNHVPFPFKWSALLDEQLDEATLELMRVPIDNFEPLLGVVVSKNLALWYLKTQKEIIRKPHNFSSTKATEDTN